MLPVSLRPVYDSAWRSAFHPDRDVKSDAWQERGLRGLLDDLDRAGRERRAVVDVLRSAGRYTAGLWRHLLDEAPFAAEGSRAKEVWELVQLADWLAMHGLAPDLAVDGFPFGRLALRVAFESPAPQAMGCTRFFSLKAMSGNKHLHEDLPDRTAAGVALVYALALPPAAALGPSGWHAAASQAWSRGKRAALSALVLLWSAFVRMCVLVAVPSIVLGNRPVSGALTSALDLAWGVVIRKPLRSLYRNGPVLRIAGLSIGFWEGRAAPAVCAELTNTGAAFWAEDPARRSECDLMLAAREGAFLASFEAVVYLILFLHVVFHVLLPGAKDLVARPMGEKREKHGAKAGAHVVRKHAAHEAHAKR